MISPSTLMQPLYSAANLLRRHVPSVAQQRNDAHLLDQMARGITYFLGESGESAGSLALAAVAQRRRLRGKDRQSGPLVPVDTARLSLAAALEQGSCLLALPLNTAAIHLLRELASDERLQLILIESPAVRALLNEFPVSGRTLPRCTTQDVIGRVKAGAGTRRPVAYVSFPELHTLGHGTTAPVSFLDKPCRFSLLEPLLCRYALNTLVTIGHSDAEPDLGLRLVTWDSAACRATGQGKSIRITLDWLFGHLQAMAAAMPVNTLSWPQLYRASLQCYQIERGNQLKQLEAYFDAWRNSRAGLLESTHQFAMARIAAMRDAS